MFWGRLIYIESTPLSSGLYPSPHEKIGPTVNLSRYVLNLPAHPFVVISAVRVFLMAKSPRTPKPLGRYFRRTIDVSRPRAWHGRPRLLSAAFALRTERSKYRTLLHPINGRTSQEFSVSPSDKIGAMWPASLTLTVQLGLGVSKREQVTT